MKDIELLITKTKQNISEAQDMMKRHKKELKEAENFQKEKRKALKNTSADSLLE